MKQLLFDCKADGHCAVCGEPWPIEAETLEPHICPPGFREIREKRSFLPPRTTTGPTREAGAANDIIEQLQAVIDKTGYANMAAVLPQMVKLQTLCIEQRALFLEGMVACEKRINWLEGQIRLVKQAQPK